MKNNSDMWKLEEIQICSEYDDSKKINQPTNQKPKTKNKQPSPPKKTTPEQNRKKNLISR